MRQSMNRCLSVFAVTRAYTVAIVLGVVSIALLGSADKPRPADGWGTDYAQATALARQTGKPIFVVFR